MKKSLAQWDREQQARKRELERVLEKYDQIATAAWVISTLAKYAFWTTTCITLVANFLPGFGIKIASSQLETVVTIDVMGMIAAAGTTVMGIADRKLDEVHDLLDPAPLIACTSQSLASTRQTRSPRRTGQLPSPAPSH